ncbi:single-stranded DNA-binding protein [Intrasporangium oryzae NRRL B-24470]|uniref:Single-stranded DNA-binding protein n=1 Tax=Intrasporangium oryzae NRRL B-24470 TaxID=1386089 RepID=W9GAW8_9MICO|nr:single-stranded DNA-binding protein [Intrasporangium oryzae]EWT00989.1 single-stranded DNA-binding protein [Intrasporangium oryzae NRRL B-24470]
MNETRVTVHGNVVAEPTSRQTRTGGIFTTFRIATTPYRRTADGRFVDGETSFFSVIAFNALAANVGKSLKKGHPVIVTGKLGVREWQGADGQPRVSVEVDAEHIGHDLSWGQASFERVSRAAALGYDRLAEPDVAASLRALADGEATDGDAARSDDTGDAPYGPAAAGMEPEGDDVMRGEGDPGGRPANVDADGVVHDLDETRATRLTGDPETDTYTVVGARSA